MLFHLFSFVCHYISHSFFLFTCHSIVECLLIIVNFSKRRDKKKKLLCFFFRVVWSSTRCLQLVVKSLSDLWNICKYRISFSRRQFAAFVNTPNSTSIFFSSKIVVSFLRTDKTWTMRKWTAYECHSFTIEYSQTTRTRLKKIIINQCFVFLVLFFWFQIERKKTRKEHLMDGYFTIYSVV